MAALIVPSKMEKRRVKVYELRNNDWFDRGTGFCNGTVVNDEPTIFVNSEEEPVRPLLQTRISKDDGYQRQQETLIVWTESNGLDMALSFQEADGCATIWDFVNQVQQSQLNGQDDGLSDDQLDGFDPPVMPPIPELSNLVEIEHIISSTSQSPQGRDMLTKFLLGEDYIRKLLPLIEMAEDLQALADLHKLNKIMKMFILLNDNQIVEYMVSEELVMGVLAALEYDPEFPNYKANHREYLKNKSRFKEVVPIESPEVKKKIHVTWRLQYLKDVVLARILDDPTFGVLNSMIFFNQVDIVNHLQSNSQYMKDLFSIVDNRDTEASKRKDAITFIQQCCQIAKNLQPPARATLYNNFISNGLVPVITAALSAQDAGTRHAGVDILVAMIDHDAGLVRQHIHQALKEKRISLIDALIRLLLTEEDLGAKAQAADALKVLLDPQSNQPELARANNEFMAKLRIGAVQGAPVESFIEDFYNHSAKTLFRPLKDLEGEDVGRSLSFHDGALFQYLIEILIFFIRQHQMRSKFFIAGECISAQIGKLLQCSSKHVKLTAVKYFRTCVGLQDDFYFQQVRDNRIFGPILDIVIENGPRDNLLNSACLEIFEYVRREGIRPMIAHIVENYREPMESISFVDIFQDIVRRYDHLQEYQQNANVTIFPAEGDELGPRPPNGHSRWGPGLREADEAEEAYFNTSDDEDGSPGPEVLKSDKLSNGTGSPRKPLVDYPDEDEEDAANSVPESPRDALITSFYAEAADPNVNGVGVIPEATSEDIADAAADPTSHLVTADAPSPSSKPAEGLAPKRRREEDEDDELMKLTTSKRRSSSSSTSSIAAAGSEKTNGVFSLAHGEGRKDTAKSPNLRRKQSFNSNVSETGKGRKMSISFTLKNNSKAEDTDTAEEDKADDEARDEKKKDAAPQAVEEVA